MAMTTRKKQGDVFSGGQTFFEAFADIIKADITIWEQGPGNEGLGVRLLTQRSCREYINCSNVDCSGKGLALGHLLREMQKNHWIKHKAFLACDGKLESFPSKPCSNIFKVRIYLQFKGTDGATAHNEYRPDKM